MLPRVMNCPAIAASIHWEKLCEIRGLKQQDYMGWSKQPHTVGRRTNEPAQNLPVAAFLILNILSHPQTKMDVECFFLADFAQSSSVRSNLCSVHCSFQCTGQLSLRAKILTFPNHVKFSVLPKTYLVHWSVALQKDLLLQKQSERKVFRTWKWYWNASS